MILHGNTAFHFDDDGRIVQVDAIYEALREDGVLTLRSHTLALDDAETHAIIRLAGLIVPVSAQASIAC